MKHSEKRHTVDILFVITLFGVFALSLCLLIAIGANVYQNIVNNMNDNYNERTAYSYIENKIHQGDRAGQLAVGKYKDLDAFIITEEIDNVQFCTYLYMYDGKIKELFTRKGQDFNPSFGNDILEVSDFNITRITDSFFKFEICTVDGTDETLFIHARSNR